MRITELLKKESIELGVKVADKNAAIDKLISLMVDGLTVHRDIRKEF